MLFVMLIFLVLIIYIVYIVYISSNGVKERMNNDYKDLIDVKDKIDYNNDLPVNRLRIMSLSPYRLFRKYDTIDIEKINSNTETDIIIIKPSMLKIFVNKYLPKIKSEIVLVFSDSAVYGSDRSVYNYKNFLSRSNIKHVFSENWYDYEHPKLTLIPIGTESKTAIKNKEKYLIQESKNSEMLYNKPLKVLSNMHFRFYYMPKSGHYNQRLFCYLKLRNNKNIDFWREKKPQIETWKEHKNYKFELSPTGNGLDCHRFYEAIMLDTLPIVMDGPLTPLYKQFSCVIVKDWNEINSENLEKWSKIPIKKDNLTFGYWKNKILTFC